MQHLAVFRVHRTRDQHVIAVRQPLGHQHRFGERGRAVVHRSVSHFLAGDLAHQGLKFKNRGQRALREFGLVGRVRSKKLAALDDGVGYHGAKMRIDSGTEKRGVAPRIFVGPRLEVLNDFRLRQRTGQREWFAQAKFFRDRFKKFVNRFRANGGEHFLTFRGAFGKITHSA